MARILRQATVARDGWHNAFTDLQFWQGCYWVAYRKGSAHASIDGEICLSVSRDRERFREMARLKVPGDNRDPKIVLMGEEHMALCFPTWVGGHEKLHLEQYVAFSADGFNWAKPEKIISSNRWLFRVCPHDGKYYGCSYGPPTDRNWGDKGYRLELLVSDDMRSWEIVTRIGMDDLQLNECGMWFFPDGELWIVARTGRPSRFSMFCCAKPPYKKWEILDLNVMIHAPVIIEHNGALYVAGRRHAILEGDPAYPFPNGYEVGVWRLEKGKAEPVLRIPAFGDCAYPGLIKDPEGRVCLSYYSQHAYLLGVLPDNRLAKLAAPTLNLNDFLSLASDVYFAELELP